MVIRPSSSQWSLSPETIMSHHYRLTRGVKPAVDMSPPCSMYNSPISIHYIPRRAASADAARRNNLPKPHRELSAFINGQNPSLKLNLPLRSSRNELVKPKLLSNRNYYPPIRRTKKPPLPLPEKVVQQEHPIVAERERKREKHRNSHLWIAFKDCVYSYIIQRGVYTDGIIVDTVESEMEKWDAQMSWSELELLREEIYSELGVKTSEVIRVNKARRMTRRPSSVDSAISSSSQSTSSKASSSSSAASTSTKSSKSSIESSKQSKSSESDTSQASSSRSSTESSSDSDSSN